MSASCVWAATAAPSPSDYQGSPLTADIGFIVYNELNYPNLTGMFARLGVETVASCMSFAVSADGGRFEWRGGGNDWWATGAGLFAQPANLLSPSYLRMLTEIAAFGRQSVVDLRSGRLGAINYSPNTVYLHRDTRLMPNRRRAWASWNFLRFQREGEAISATSCMRGSGPSAIDSATAS